MAKTRSPAIAKTGEAKMAKPAVVVNTAPAPDDLRQIFKVIETTSDEDILRYAEMPGVELEFDVVRFRRLEDNLVAMLPPIAQKNYWLSFAEYEGRKKLADRALFETPGAVDPMSKLLDGPRGMSNPLTHDQAEVEKLLGPDWYITWRIQGGQGDLEGALQSGFRVMRRPKDEAERKAHDPREWNGEVWRVRDGTVDPTSGDEIFNVMVYIRAQAWKDNLQAMSMVSHNAYSNNKKQFFENTENISRDMLSSRERIQVSDLDEMHVEEHTVGGKRT
jgi:hypothetical protein